MFVGPSDARWIQMNFHKRWHINRYDVACDLKKFAVLSVGHFGVK